MALRYTVEELIHLSQSPLCVKPNSLPPKEDWMGQLSETYRNNQGTARTGTDKTRNGEGALLDQTNRRPGVDRHSSRNTTNAEGIVLGPPRTTFSSSTATRGSKPFDNDKPFASFRRNGDGDNDRERVDRDRDGRGNFRRRGDDGEQDSDGWSTVKPRKSFGHEGAERFNGRMGGDRFGAERRPRDSQDETNDKPKRSNFGEFGREKDGDDERPRRNGLPRNRTDQATWGRGDIGDSDAPPSRERFDRAKSWRDRAAPPEDQPTDSKPRDRNFNRWDRDRDQRQERDPEWFDEGIEEKPQAHSIQDLQKFMESMKAQKKGDAVPEQGPAPSSINTSVREASFDIEATKVKSAPAVEMGPDQFFAKYAVTPSADIENPHEVPKESAPPKPKGGSRFGSFFASQQGRQTEPSTPAAAPQPAQEINPLLQFGGANVAANIAAAAPTGSPSGMEDRAAFQNILLKLKKQHISNTPPSAGGFSAPPAEPERGPSSSVASPGPYPPFNLEHRDGPPSRGPVPPEMLASRPQPPSYPIPGPMGTEAQLLQNLIAQRQPVASPAGGRDQAQVRNSQTEFLMSLMQSGRHAPPEVQRPEPHIRMPQPSRPAQIPQTPDREPDFQRERSGSHQQGRPQGPPGFFDESQLRLDQDNRRQQQPTQILQRPISMGVDQMQPNWLQGANQPPPPGPGRHMIPPPGLAGNPRNAPPPGMFPPGFHHAPMVVAPPMGAFPPEAMRNMAPPPGLFGGPGGPGGPPPPGFLPPGMSGGFHGGPEALAFGFDGRGMPPPGAANFRRG
ncbi:hypothetical protein PFICI_04490 [Pestalotiopsis fici W106-1]|uniref:Uncharacterized protein n=1 Tax=Pestalotiopsis fici (strain W106-1 / CGMCC3.15140) TaxID=1229662 RepID=W3X998_PESFW|nr:uncharacterized protein PFICI_04490 [Pestalotiopsis fici W106-1]ETS82614.1 hypothetical protein PFICI_04490 [Pestalotiopsis fici W106-1]